MLTTHRSAIILAGTFNQQPIMSDDNQPTTLGEIFRDAALYHLAGDLQENNKYGPAIGMCPAIRFACLDMFLSSLGPYAALHALEASSDIKYGEHTYWMGPFHSITPDQQMIRFMHLCLLAEMYDGVTVEQYLKNNNL